MSPHNIIMNDKSIESNGSSSTTTSTVPAANHIQIGGRKSKLAVKQSEIVKQEIETAFPELSCSILALSTLGDKVQSKPLYSFGGKSLWTKELEILLLEAVEPFPKLDLIVHSLKDMPTNLPEEFELGCIIKREDPRDAVIMPPNSPYKTLADLPPNALVGTSSIRRSAQLLKNYPHLKFESVRGNVFTRLTKLDTPTETQPKFECIILAAAGLIRVGLGDRINQYLDAPDMYYAVGQGALGVEIRSNDPRIKSIVSKIEHLPTAYRCLAERSLMRYLEGGCSVPLGVESFYDESSRKLLLKAVIVSPDGLKSVEDQIETIINDRNDCEIIGKELGDKLIAKGAKEILDLIDYERINQPPISTPVSEVNSL
ncbi:porphobilinogen deaminase, dipyromethane cofactor binding domain-containing protein [Scheffersomyces coipomensis]|uniref:porphobilinogen deaminase, dipyromethane cofactor binding domain-containing protein n=1 Tax=Scheffersomyces coipomensis TaxID=1788519 RepID=UPI00315C7A9D